MSKKLDREAFSNFVRALAFASRKHSQQRRKDAEASPYINHSPGFGNKLTFHTLIRHVRLWAAARPLA